MQIPRHHLVSRCLQATSDAGMGAGVPITCLRYRCPGDFSAALPSEALPTEAPTGTAELHHGTLDIWLTPGFVLHPATASFLGHIFTVWRRLETQKAMFAASAHEVLNSLTILQFRLGALRERLAGSDEVQTVKRMLVLCERIEMELEDALAGGGPVRLSRFSLKGLAQEIVDGLLGASLAGEDVVTGEDGFVTSDALRVGRIIRNLVLNAAQAVGGHGRIQVLVETGSGGTVEVAVRDDGPGVVPGLRAGLFHEFRSTKPGGHGLGLAFSQSLATGLGGVLEYHPLDPGSEFRLRLPRDFPASLMTAAFSDEFLWR